MLFTLLSQSCKCRLWLLQEVLPVEGEVVQMVVHVDWIDVSEVDQLLQSLVDEDDAYEGGEGLLCEAGDVADQRAGVSGHQQEAEEGRPQSNAGPQGQVGQAVVAVDKHREAPRRYFSGSKTGLIIFHHHKMSRLRILSKAVDSVSTASLSQQSH